MESATYRIIDSFPEVADYIHRSSIKISSLDLQDEIARIYDVKVSAQTITKWRKQLPSHKIKVLREEKAKNILGLKFVIDLLKEEIKKIEDPNLKLKCSQEIVRSIEKIDLIIDDEIEYLKNCKPY